MTNTPKAELFGCFDAPNELTHLDQARQHVIDTTPVTSAVESVSTQDTDGRVLANDVLSRIDIPAADNAAMDGYAVAGTELKDDATRLTVIGEAFAGRPFDGTVTTAECVRIMTGAYLPAGTDTVIAQEDIATSSNPETIVVGRGHRTGQNVRNQSEDVKTGAVVLHHGQRIASAEAGVLASLGINRVNVYKRPVVAIFSTGDELVEPGVSAPWGKLFDCNRTLLHSLVRRAGCDVTDLGILEDKPDTVRNALNEASLVADAVITSGGISTGDADYVSDALQALGELGVWRIALRPGRPFAYGRIGDARFFGLPGNPVAVMTTFYMLVLPALRRLSGDRRPWQPEHFLVRSVKPVRKKPNRTELYRAVLSQDADGELVVETTGNQGSGLLTSMSRANCFIVLDHDAVSTDAGDRVPVIPFDGII